MLGFILKGVWYSNTFSWDSDVSFLASDGSLSFSHLSQKLVTVILLSQLMVITSVRLSSEVLMLEQQVLLPAEPSHLSSLPVCFAFEISSWLS